MLTCARVQRAKEKRRKNQKAQKRIPASRSSNVRYLNLDNHDRSGNLYFSAIDGPDR